jgi:hypothetical protein
MQDADTQAVLRGQEFYRLKQAVQSPGDIYELDLSSRSIYIGPDSDISEVQVQYYDPAALPTQIQNATFAVNGPFVARLDSLLATTVPTTGQPGRLLISPVDLVDNAYTPPTPVANKQFNIPAMIDVIVALKSLSSIPGVRADRTFRYPNTPWYTGNVTAGPAGNNGSTNLIIPIYGRRMVSVQVSAGAVGVVVTMSLVTLVTGGMAPQPRQLGQIITPTSSTTSKFTRAAVYRASDAARQGAIYDATTGPPYTQSSAYLESDQPPSTAETVAPAPRGLADLMVLNLAAHVPGGAGTGTLQYADIFIKMSDRET